MMSTTGEIQTFKTTQPQIFEWVGAEEEVETEEVWSDDEVETEEEVEVQAPHEATVQQLATIDGRRLVDYPLSEEESEDEEVEIVDVDEMPDYQIGGSAFDKAFQIFRFEPAAGRQQLDLVHFLQKITPRLLPLVEQQIERGGQKFILSVHVQYRHPVDGIVVDRDLTPKYKLILVQNEAVIKMGQQIDELLERNGNFVREKT